MAFVALHDVSIRFRGPLLLDGVSAQIEEGQRIGLVGRNGAGKTTLLRMLCGQVTPDHGTIELADGVHVSLLPQDVPLDLTGTIRQVVASGLPEGWQHSDAPWEYEHNIERVLQDMDLCADDRVERLSSGRKRRVLLAKSLAAKPRVLLLDEPTNHLDIPSIQWLEEFLRDRWPGTLLFVTHDRVFLQHVATRIWDIDRGHLFDWSCDYETFLRRKAAALEAEEQQNALFDKKLAEEEAWIRQGIKARRTRNEGRVRALKAMRLARGQRQESAKAVRLNIQEGQRSGNLVAEVDDITFAYADKLIVAHFSTLIMRGDKVGVIGPNGAGKTTLLRLLLGELPPQSGRVRLGTNLHIAYFDQLREQLAEDQTVQENVGDGYDTVEVGGKPQHVLGYLQNFLFTPERARTQVRFLSGGERNRVLLAKLFAKSANVIVLDEPTNDLDAETLELLEDQLIQFAGTVIVVSHDRAFLNQVVTSSIVFEEDGVREYVGGYDDWLRQKKPSTTKTTRTTPPSSRQTKSDSPAAATEIQVNDKKLSFKERKELTELPHRIEQWDAEVSALQLQMADPKFYQRERSEIIMLQRRLEALQADLQSAYARWEELENRA